ncbi:hypothetical protein HanXRQr2_Chr16g0767121 [Helianthus annuus]|uniref:Uncharacterized protein n=1 Tax=Helianthus annuus TaxID=4232 RepID=A0A9K3DW40_HELAN|nr:hypothetical protein HanXRQr2_Chr16g0767121 [Helianthus annuus]KAJ0439428.1 hypothetical protein HanHA300_Chr16g0625221 [Helianthus annuus]KAJ0444514.1 hypothetical protein HanIR_Chr16g0832671 [Helianthus annuus]KAJ0461795.1 hypothetical protein HanHA89_Chr16g0676371 [Helianthus annuus]KAJ0642181.1 hypothetical protein HanLR1_Chr16g0635481 [Helianthus annuus]
MILLINIILILWRFGLVWYSWVYDVMLRPTVYHVCVGCFGIIGLTQLCSQGW